MNDKLKERLARVGYEAWAKAIAARCPWFDPFPWDELREDREQWLSAAEAMIAAAEQEQER